MQPCKRAANHAVTAAASFHSGWALPRTKRAWHHLDSIRRKRTGIQAYHSRPSQNIWPGTFPIPRPCQTEHRKPVSCAVWPDMAKKGAGASWRVTKCHRATPETSKQEALNGQVCFHCFPFAFATDHWSITGPGFEVQAHGAMTFCANDAIARPPLLRLPLK